MLRLANRSPSRQLQDKNQAAVYTVVQRLGKMNVPPTSTADPPKPMVDSIGSRKRRPHSLRTMVRNHNKMEATACLDWKRVSPLSSLWVQLNRILRISTDIGVQVSDVIFPYWVVSRPRPKFQLKDIGNLLPLYQDKIGYKASYTSHVPSWFDDNLHVRQICL